MDGFCGRPFFQIFMKSSKIPFIMYLKKNYLPSGRKEKTAAGQADFSCPNALSSGGFDYSKPPFLYPPAAHRRMPPCDYGEIGTCQKKSNHRSGTLHPGLRK